MEEFLKIIFILLAVYLNQLAGQKRTSYYDDTNRMIFPRIPQFQKRGSGKSGLPCKCGESYRTATLKMRALKSQSQSHSSIFESEFYRSLTNNHHMHGFKDYADDTNDFSEYDDQPEDRVVNGYSVKRREFYVGLEMYDSTMRGTIVCGGTLISPRYVISAAHCFCANGHQIFCRNKVVSATTDFIPMRLIFGVTNHGSREGTRAYEIESVRQPSARIKMYRSKFYAGPFDVALIKTKIRVIFEPGKIMPICLGKIRDENIDAHVTGFGLHTSMDKHGSPECWTNHRGQQIFSRCSSNCSYTSSPQPLKCQNFFNFYGGVERFRQSQKADVASIGNLKCYAVSRAGPYGWCQTKSRKESGWGFCSHHCAKLSMGKGRQDDELKETKPRMLYDDDCKRLMTPNDALYSTRFDICGGQLAGRAQVEKKYVEYKSGKYQYISTLPIKDETIIGGSDACQGDSGGPLVRYIKVRRGFQTIVKGYLIGLVSRGTGCAYKNVPGTYVRMKSFLHWLRTYIEPENACWNI